MAGPSSLGSNDVSIETQSTEMSLVTTSPTAKLPDANPPVTKPSPGMSLQDEQATVAPKQVLDVIEVKPKSKKQDLESTKISKDMWDKVDDLVNDGPSEPQITSTGRSKGLHFKYFTSNSKIHRSFNANYKNGIANMNLILV